MGDLRSLFCPRIPRRVQYSEPIQGYANDCHLIAALSSIAWVQPPATPLLFNASEIYFYNPDAGLTPSKPPLNLNTQVEPYTQNVPLDASGNAIYARSNPQKVDSWPLIYEKAYAIWLNSINPKLNLVVNNQVNYGAIPQGTGLYALQAITQGIPYTENRNPDIPASRVDSITHIPPVNAMGKTTYPTVTFTDERNGLPAGIYKNHTYSFLGFYSGGGKTYVILRNPYGPLLPDYNVGDNPAVVWNGINLAATGDGIFPIEISKFRDCFVAVNWVLKNKP